MANWLQRAGGWLSREDKGAGQALQLGLLQRWGSLQLVLEAQHLKWEGSAGRASRMDNWGVSHSPCKQPAWHALAGIGSPAQQGCRIPISIPHPALSPELMNSAEVTDLEPKKGLGQVPLRGSLSTVGY